MRSLFGGSGGWSDFENGPDGPERLTVYLWLSSGWRSFLLSPTRPILLYDNDCGICSRFAHIAGRSSKGWIDTVGLFSQRGFKIKSDFFSPADRPDDNFWLLVGDVGYGGRSGLLPLAREIVRGLIL